MKELLTMNEAIETTLTFLYHPYYVSKEDLEDSPTFKKLLDNELIYFQDNSLLYELSDKGRDILHEYIREISTKFISFMKKNGLHISEEKIITWFIETYNIIDDEQELYEYISKNLHNYGYSIVQSISSKRGRQCELRKI